MEEGVAKQINWLWISITKKMGSCIGNFFWKVESTCKDWALA